MNTEDTAKPYAFDRFVRFLNTATMIIVARPTERQTAPVSTGSWGGCLAEGLTCIVDEREIDLALDCVGSVHHTKPDAEESGSEKRPSGN
jgi:hypothetical protein